MIYSSRELIRWWPKRSQTRNRSKERENVIPGANDLSQTPGYPGHLIFTTLLLLNYRTGPLVIALRPDNVPVGHMWPPTAVSIETIAARCETPPFFLSLFLAKTRRSTVCQDRLGTNTRQKTHNTPVAFRTAMSRRRRAPPPFVCSTCRRRMTRPESVRKGRNALFFLRGGGVSLSFFIIIFHYHYHYHFSWKHVCACAKTGSGHNIALRNV